MLGQPIGEAVGRCARAGKFRGHLHTIGRLTTGPPGQPWSALQRGEPLDEKGINVKKRAWTTKASRQDIGYGTVRTGRGSLSSTGSFPACAFGVQSSRALPRTRIYRYVYLPLLHMQKTIHTHLTHTYIRNGDPFLHTYVLAHSPIRRARHARLSIASPSVCLTRALEGFRGICQTRLFSPCSQPRSAELAACRFTGEKEKSHRTAHAS